jgi:hypothetical protein
MGTRKMAKGAIFLSFLLVTNNLLSIKSPLKGLIMLFRPPNLSTTPCPTLSHYKQSGMCLRKPIFALPCLIVKMIIWYESGFPFCFQV